MKKLKTYECRIDNFFEDGSPLISNHVALNPSKARYLFWYIHQDGIGSYAKCFSHIKSKSLGIMEPSHMFGDYDKFKRICEHRNLPFAFQGMKIDVSGKKGWIVGGNSSMNLDVLFEGETFVSNCHPTWETTYYDSKMNVVAEFKNK